MFWLTVIKILIDVLEKNNFGIFTLSGCDKCIIYIVLLPEKEELSFCNIMFSDY